jgi:hypothetical protein
MQVALVIAIIRKRRKKNMENGSQASITNAVNGALAMYRINGMEFLVKVVDARKVYGRVDAQITPVNGAGFKWVEASALILNSEAKEIVSRK